MDNAICCAGDSEHTHVAHGVATRSTELSGYDPRPTALSESLDAYGTPEGAVRLAHRDSWAHVERPTTLTREAREELERLQLTPGATLSRGAGSRLEAEEPDAYRTCFERDLDRIKHSKAFRRLAGKCQVFIAPDDDHLRTRLSHAIEVAQVATAVSSALGLNVRLTEAIALAHDCGHGPAGHASEDAFSPYSPTGVHDHAVWGAEVTLAGLNLCQETLDGVRSHSWKLPAPSTPEGEVVSWADRIAYCAHDFDDAVGAGIVTAKELPREVALEVGSRQSRQLGAFAEAMIAATAQTGRIGMLEGPASALEVFRKFNYERIYLRPASAVQAGRAISLLRALVDHYGARPERLPLDDPELYGPGGLSDVPIKGSLEAHHAAVRYVSGMTDRFAIRQAQELLSWPAHELPRGV